MTTPRSSAAAPLALTIGEPAGIGPELCLGLAADHPASVVLVGDLELLRARARLLGRTIRLHALAAADVGAGLRPDSVAVVHVPLAHPPPPGKPDPRNAQAVLETLRLALDGCQRGLFRAMVTAPVDKGVIRHAGLKFTGHTEFLAELTGTPLPVMLLVAGTLRVALVTTHLPLREVPEAITQPRLTDTLRVLEAGLRRHFALPRPRIAVCGLNPHAGEGGTLGTEDAALIAPVLERLRADGMDLSGPVPADTAFTPARLAGCDAVLCMYHDQGLPVLKHAGFGHAVNVTLGLPVVRTSVDHGTAYDLAGTGLADGGSLAAAVTLADRLSRPAPA